MHTPLNISPKEISQSNKLFKKTLNHMMRNKCDRDPLKATDYGVSRSNIATIGVVNNFELISESINIFPNPTTNLITIQSEIALNDKFKIYDHQRREVMNGKLSGKNTEVSLYKLSRGSYTP